MRIRYGGYWLPECDKCANKGNDEKCPAKLPWVWVDSPGARPNGVCRAIVTVKSLIARMEGLSKCA
jgi:hypothetical protein